MLQARVAVLDVTTTRRDIAAHRMTPNNSCTLDGPHKFAYSLIVERDQRPRSEILRSPIAYISTKSCLVADLWTPNK